MMNISPYLIPGLIRYDLDEVVCSRFQITNEQLYSKSRKREIVQARQVVMWFDMKLNDNKTLAEVGAKFGFKHCNVLHAVKTVNNLSFTDEHFRSLFQSIENEIS